MKVKPLFGSWVEQIPLKLMNISDEIFAGT